MVARRLLRPHADGGVRSMSAGGRRAATVNRQVVDLQLFGATPSPARLLTTPEAWTGRAHPSIDCRISARRSALVGHAPTTPDRRASATRSTRHTAPLAGRSCSAFVVASAAGPSLAVLSRWPTTASDPSCCARWPRDSRRGPAIASWRGRWAVLHRPSPASVLFSAGTPSCCSGAPSPASRASWTSRSSSTISKRSS